MLRMFTPEKQGLLASRLLMPKKQEIQGQNLKPESVPLFRSRS